MIFLSILLLAIVGCSNEVQDDNTLVEPVTGEQEAEEETQIEITEELKERAITYLASTFCEDFYEREGRPERGDFRESRSYNQIARDNGFESRRDVNEYLGEIPTDEIDREIGSVIQSLCPDAI